MAETTDIANVGSRSLNDTSLVCGVFATGDNWQAIDWADTLTYVVEPTTVFGSSVPANSCLRVEAYNTTGLYVIDRGFCPAMSSNADESWLVLQRKLAAAVFQLSLPSTWSFLVNNVLDRHRVVVEEASGSSVA